MSSSMNKVLQILGIFWLASFFYGISRAIYRQQSCEHSILKRKSFRNIMYCGHCGAVLDNPFEKILH